MSKYVQHEIRSLTNLETLLAALAQCGYADGKVEVHETAQPLYGFGGDRRAESAHVIIRRHNTGISASNDIGFLRQSDGSYRPIVSEYDTRNLRIGAQRTPFVQAVEQAYGALTANAAVRTLLHDTLPRLKQLGKVSRNATITTQVVGNETRILAKW